jgi:hypothetical protein
MRVRKNKAEQVEKSIRSIIRLLECVISQPSAFVDNRLIRDALTSQKRLAGLTYSDDSGLEPIEVTPLSLTTLKSKVSSLSDGFDFESLNRLRTQALDAITLAGVTSINQSAVNPSAPHSQPKLTTKENLQREINSLRDTLEKHREANFRLLQTLNRSISAIETIKGVSDKDLRLHKAAQEIDSIKKTLLLNDYPFNSTQRTATIVSIKPESQL